MQTIQLLTEARKKLNLTSDAALAQYLETSHATVGHWRTGKHLPDATQCAKLAVIVGIDPLEVIATFESQRLKRAPENAAFWKKHVTIGRELIFSLADIRATKNHTSLVRLFYNSHTNHNESEHSAERA